MGNSLIVSLVMASAFIAGMILMNYLMGNLPYEESPTISVKKLNIPVDLFLDMDKDGSPEHFYLFFGKEGEIRVVFEGEVIEKIPPVFGKCEVFLVEDKIPKIYIKLSDEKTKHVILWKPGETLLKVEFYADSLKWMTPSKVEMTSHGERYNYLICDEPPFFTSESTGTVEFLMKGYR